MTMTRIRHALVALLIALVLIGLVPFVIRDAVNGTEPEPSIPGLECVFSGGGWLCGPVQSTPALVPAVAPSSVVAASAAPMVLPDTALGD